MNEKKKAIRHINMEKISPSLSVIILNVNGLNFQIKKSRTEEQIFKN